MQGSVYSVDGILADIEEHRVNKYIHIHCSVLGTTCGCSLALKQRRNQVRVWLLIHISWSTLWFPMFHTDACKAWSSTCNTLGLRTWRCVRFLYSSSLQSSCVEKLNSWQWRGPLLHWRRKTRGSWAPITMNSCSWGNFLSGKNGRSCRDGTGKVRYVIWDQRVRHT